MAEPARLDALAAVIGLLNRERDPAVRLRAIAAVRAGLRNEDDRLRNMTRDAILDLRRDRPDIDQQEIADLLGVTRQRISNLLATYERTPQPT